MLKLKSQLKKKSQAPDERAKDVTLTGSTEWKSEVGRWAKGLSFCLVAFGKSLLFYFLYCLDF